MKIAQDSVVLNEEIVKPGHLLCPGCVGGTAWRLVTKVLGPTSILVHSASCFGNPVMIYPSCLAIPSLYVSFASASAAMSGVSAALTSLEKEGKLKEKVNLLVFAGDGGTADIGFASLSAAAERNENLIYICADNEAYMNTGIQRSSQTPYGTWTMSTPNGKGERQKDMPTIMAAHKIKYTATASASYPEDLVNKIIKARDIGKGFKYIHIHVPCPTGWRFAESLTVKIGRLAVETGMWRLTESIDGGKFKATYKPKERKPIKEYLSAQGRFGKLSEEDIEKLQKEVDENCRKLGF